MRPTILNIEVDIGYQWIFRAHNKMSSDNTGKLAGKMFICMIGLMLIFIGGVFEWLMLRSYLHAKESRQWPQVEAVILSSDMDQRRISGSPPEARLNLLFEYDYKGNKYTSGRLSPRGAKWSREKDSVADLMVVNPVGSFHSVWVNPKSPDTAILKHDTKAAGYTIWFPAVIMIGGCGMIWGALRDKDN